MINQKKADIKGWTPKKHLRGWTPEFGWKRNVPIRDGKTKERDPVTAGRRARDALQKGAALPDGAVTVERLERALAVVAYLIGLDGPKVVPLFERLERELAAMRQTEDAMGRARRMVESYSDQHPFLLLAPPIDQIDDEPGTGVHSTAPQPASDPQ